MPDLSDGENLSDEQRELLDKLIDCIAEVMQEQREERIRAYKHVVMVGAAKPGVDNFIDVWTPKDPMHAHCLLEPEQYTDFLAVGLIEFDYETGYPCYVGEEPLR